MEKVIRDGKVAILYSPGYGAGWSTWSSPGDVMMFHPLLVSWVEGGKEEPIEDIVDTILGPDNSFYLGGAGNLRVAWLPVGTRFHISEHDGYEEVETTSDYGWVTA